MKKTISITILVILFCSFGFSQNYSPISPNEVKVYSVHKKPANFEVIASISASSDADWGQKRASRKNLEKLKKKAAKIGANGIIIDYTGTEDQAAFVMNNMIISSSYSTANATAIRVFSDSTSNNEISNIEESQINNDVTQFRFYYPIPTGQAETVKIELARESLYQAYEAYNINKDLKSTKFYLDQCERNGVVDAPFYYLLGRWAYDRGDKKAAKRYWQRGGKNANCDECIDLYTAVKFDKSILPEIEKHQTAWKKSIEE